MSESHSPVAAGLGPGTGQTPATSEAPGDGAAPDGMLARVGRELEEEVRRLRKSGAFPPSFEHRLDRLFARVVPAGAADREAEDALAHVERSSHVDIEVPLGSRMPGVGLVKRALRKLMGWYLNYLVQQVNRFAASTVRALRLLHERVGRLEDEDRARHPPAPPPAQRRAEVDLSVWAELVRTRLAGVVGPVLHADCGEGGLLADLVAGGLDAYGTDPRAELLDEAELAGLEVRWEEAVDHLSGLGDASLGGLVLSGCVDRLEVGAKRQLAALAGAKLAPGAPLVLLGTTPAAWAAPERAMSGGQPGASADPVKADGGRAAVDTGAAVAAPTGLAAAHTGLDGLAAVEADLAPGRPLHPGTWAHLLAQESLVDIEVVMGPSTGQLDRVPGDDDRTAALNANLARLEEVLYGPASYAVVGARAGRRPRRGSGPGPAAGAPAAGAPAAGAPAAPGQ